MRTLIYVSMCVALLAAAAPAGNAEDRQLSGTTLEDLAWLAGYWMSDDRGVLAEECWMAPQGRVMLGLHRDYYDDGRIMFEYLRIMESGEGIVYYASPGGYNTTKFKLTSLSITDKVKEAVFENPENEFPSLIRYTLNADGLMAAAEGNDDGDHVVATWVWKRAELPAGRADN